MNQPAWIGPIVDRAVAQAFESHATQLRAEIVRRVSEAIAATDTGAASSTAAATYPTADSASLARAVAEIQLGNSQREILRALLDVSLRYAARIALFVVKGNRATGWQGRGFSNSDAVKDFALEETTPAVVVAIRDRVVTGATVADMDARFLQHVGMPANSEVQILPLILKDKVAAIVYADRGTDPAGPLDVGSLELLVLSTNAWLELTALRKQAQKEGLASTMEMSAPADITESKAAQAAPAFNDPFAAHSPAFSSSQAMAAAAPAGGSPPSMASAPMPPIAESAPSSVPANVPPSGPVVPRVKALGSFADFQPAVVETHVADPAPLAAISAEAESASVSPPAPSPADEEIHRKAARFARLLVDEIKLYNQAKLAEGKKCKDLYDRLQDVIEKSRLTYQKRYGSTVAASGNYFEHEIIRSLAEDDPSIMGANFRH